MPKWTAGYLLWDMDEVIWGEQDCAHCLFRRKVDLLLDGEPMCCSCADLVLQGELTDRQMHSVPRRLPFGKRGG